jgi:C-terminal processing protease CtpA/Prc
VIRQPDGWVIDYVTDGSPASRAGLAVGDRIMAVAGIPVAEMPEEVFDVLIQSGPSVRLRVYGPCGLRDLEIPVVTFLE